MPTTLINNPKINIVRKKYLKNRFNLDGFFFEALIFFFDLTAFSFGTFIY